MNSPKNLATAVESDGVSHRSKQVISLENTKVFLNHKTGQVQVAAKSEWFPDGFIITLPQGSKAEAKALEGLRSAKESENTKEQTQLSFVSFELDYADYHTYAKGKVFPQGVVNPTHCLNQWAGYTKGKKWSVFGDMISLREANQTKMYAQEAYIGVREDGKAITVPLANTSENGYLGFHNISISGGEGNGRNAVLYDIKKHVSAFNPSVQIVSFSHRFSNQKRVPDEKVLIDDLDYLKFLRNCENDLKLRSNGYRKHEDCEDFYALDGFDHTYVIIEGFDRFVEKDSDSLKEDGLLLVDGSIELGRNAGNYGRSRTFKAIRAEILERIQGIVTSELKSSITFVYVTDELLNGNASAFLAKCSTMIQMGPTTPRQHNDGITKLMDLKANQNREENSLPIRVADIERGKGVIIHYNPESGHSSTMIDQILIPTDLSPDDMDWLRS